MTGPIKAIPEGHTKYDKTVLNRGSLTLKEFLDILEKEYGLEVTMVIAGSGASKEKDSVV